MATIVPIVSKKSASSRVKISSAADTKPILLNDPSRLKSPTSEKSGRAKGFEGRVGTLRPHPVGLTILPPGPVCEPMCSTASSTIASTVAPAMP